MFAIVITSVLHCETCCVDSSSTRCQQLALAALALELNHMCLHLQNKMKDQNHYRGVDVAIYIQEWWFAMEDMLLMRGDICLNQCWQCWHTWPAFSRRTFDCRCWWPTLQGTFWCLLWTNVVLQWHTCLHCWEPRSRTCISLGWSVISCSELAMCALSEQSYATNTSKAYIPLPMCIS